MHQDPARSYAGLLLGPPCSPPPARDPSHPRLTEAPPWALLMPCPATCYSWSTHPHSWSVPCSQLTALPSPENGPPVQWLREPSDLTTASSRWSQRGRGQPAPQGEISSMVLFRLQGCPGVRLSWGLHPTLLPSFLLSTLLQLTLGWAQESLWGEGAWPRTTPGH